MNQQAGPFRVRGPSHWGQLQHLKIPGCTGHAKTRETRRGMGPQWPAAGATDATMPPPVLSCQLAAVLAAPHAAASEARRLTELQAARMHVPPTQSMAQTTSAPHTIARPPQTKRAARP